METAIATTDDGMLAAIYNENCLRVIKITRSGTPATGNWPLCGVEVWGICTHSTGVGMTSDGSGGAFVTWTRIVGQGWHVFSTHIDASGEHAPGWPADGLELTGYSFTGVPASVPDGAGGFIVLIYNEYGPYYVAQRISSDGELLWGEDGIVRADPPVEWITAVSDDAGGALFAMSVVVGAKDHDLYAQRIGSDGAIVAGWPVGGVLIASGPGYQSWGNEMRGVSDGAGGAIFVWMDNQNESTNGWDVFATRISSSGEVLWGEGGLPLSVGEGDQGYPALASDGDGGAFFMWQSMQRIDDPDVYVQHVDKTGQAQMHDNGQLLAGSSRAQESPSILGDGAGGAYVSWRDGVHNQAPWRVMLQHISGTGSVMPGWSLDGKELTDYGAFTTASMVSDGADGVFVAYHEWSNELRAQRCDTIGGTVAVPAATNDVLTLRTAGGSPNGTQASFELGAPAGVAVTVEVFNSAGRRIRGLDFGSSSFSGQRVVDWDLRDDVGRDVASGVYFVRAFSGSHRALARIVVVR